MDVFVISVIVFLKILPKLIIFTHIIFCYKYNFIITIIFLRQWMKRKRDKSDVDDRCNVKRPKIDYLDVDPSKDEFVDSFATPGKKKVSLCLISPIPENHSTIENRLGYHFKHK